jgi:hypothetical protein
VPGADATEDEHPAVADGVEVLGLELEALPGRAQVAHVLGEPLVSPVRLRAPREQAGDRRNLDLGVREVDQGVEVAVAERRVRTADDRLPFDRHGRGSYRAANGRSLGGTFGTDEAIRCMSP